MTSNNDAAIQIVTLICGVVTALGVPLVAYLLQRLNSKADTAADAVIEVKKVAASAAIKVHEVKAALAESTAASFDKLDEALAVAHATHTLVNNAMSVQLRENAELKRERADRTEDPIHAREAMVAEQMYAEHMAKQAAVDQAGKAAAAPQGRRPDPTKP